GDLADVANSHPVPGPVRDAGVRGRTGFVQEAHVVSGPPLLQSATIDTIRAWHYRPWMVYGKPVPFETQVSIDFKLSGAQ
ncbi:MAG: energy transducer TonB, partial [Acidobacteriota bacterium]